MIGRLRTDDGAVLPVVAILIVVLLVVAAFVIDLGGVRVQRSANQVVADAAASAGALTAAYTSNGVDVCNDVKQYIVANSSSISDVSQLDGIDCDFFPTGCSAGTDGYTASTLVGDTLVEIAYPVVGDGDPAGSSTLTNDFMASRQIGALDQGVSTDFDGDPCDRVGVRIRSQWNGTFSRLVGSDELPADVHTVAMVRPTGGQDVALNLLVLNRSECETLTTNGGAMIRVRPVEDPDADPELAGNQPAVFPGVAAADSAADGCTGVIRLSGGGSTGKIVAMGPVEDPANPTDSCPQYIAGTLDSVTLPDASGTLITFHFAEGCGITGGVAPGSTCDPATRLCDAPADLVLPTPVQFPSQLTRAPIDHRFNCDTTYETLPTYSATDISVHTSPLLAPASNISDCPLANDPDTPDDPHIYDLVAQLGEGVPSGWSVTTNCTPADGTVFPANVVVDCGTFRVNANRTVVFEGSVIFNGSLRLNNAAQVGVNVDSGTSVGAPGTWDDNGTEAVAFFRGSGAVNDTITANIGSDGAWVLLNTMVYISKQMENVAFAGGSGPTRWTAPVTGDFEDLALWSDASTTHTFSGGGAAEMVGTFFAPWAKIDFNGGSDGALEAQFVADKLEASGGGVFELQPISDRAVTFRVSPSTSLIR